jgi:hypothetical protein
MITQTAQPCRLTMVRLDPGEDLLAGIRTAVAQSGMTNGVIVTGAGSLSSYRVHVVETTNLPPGDVFFSGEGPFDILTLNGLVIDGRVHAHITFANNEQALGGHVEEGCRVLTFAVVGLAETPDVDFANWDRTGNL